MKTIDLSARAKFRMTGADRVRYLNGQVSNDVQKASEEKVISACVTNLKGKLQGWVFIAVEAGGEAFLIDADAALRDSLMARLSKYIIADDVELTDVTEDYLLLHTPGAEGGGVVAERYAVAGKDQWLAPGELPAGGDWLSPAGEQRLRIENGVPAWGAELGEDVLPAEALLDRVSVDFHKGCYVGQEVVSRIESVGRVNRSLVALEFGAGDPPQIGWNLLDEDGKSVGSVTSVDCSEAGVSIGLGFLKRDSQPARASDCENGLSCETGTRVAPFISNTESDG